MTKVLHILPRLAIGGAEVAAYKLARDNSLNFSYSIATFRRIKEGDLRCSKHTDCSASIAPFALFKLMRLIYTHKPDVIIYSLWRSRIFFLLFRCLFPKSKHILYFHSASFANKLDRLSAKVALRIAQTVFADSKSTAEFIVSSCQYAGIIELVPPLFHQKQIIASKHPKRLVYLGRVNQRKSFENVLRLMSALTSLDESWNLDVYGPIANTEAINASVAAYKLQKRINFYGSIPVENVPSVLAKYWYLVLLSENEGMAVGVVEAMQQGVIPVVYGVGEIPSYCTNNVNSLVVNNLSKDELMWVAKNILMIHENELVRTAMSNSALSRAYSMLSMQNVLDLLFNREEHLCD